MPRESDASFTSILAAAAVGALAMYLLDPDKGRRRRAIARDKAMSVVAQTQDVAGKAARDLSHRIDGVRANVARPFRERGTPDDLRLIERVRSRIGRVVSHPHAIHVGAHQGRVPPFARNNPPILRAVCVDAGCLKVTRLDATEDTLDMLCRPRFNQLMAYLS